MKRKNMVTSRHLKNNNMHNKSIKHLRNSLITYTEATKKAHHTLRKAKNTQKELNVIPAQKWDRNLFSFFLDKTNKKIILAIVSLLSFSMLALLISILSISLNFTKSVFLSKVGIMCSSNLFLTGLYSIYYCIKKTNIQGEGNHGRRKNKRILYNDGETSREGI